MKNILNMIKTPDVIISEIASNERAMRKRAKLTQKTLSEKSGVSLGSIKRFEQSGEISLRSLLKIAAVLECEDAFLQLFTRIHYHSIQEIIDEQD